VSQRSARNSLLENLGDSCTIIGVRGPRRGSFGFLLSQSQQDVEMETAMFVVHLDGSTRKLSNPRETLPLTRRFRLAQPGCS
jgi:hypothetical protein